MAGAGRREIEWEDEVFVYDVRRGRRRTSEALQWWEAAI